MTTTRTRPVTAKDGAAASAVIHANAAARKAAGAATATAARPPRPTAKTGNPATDKANRNAATEAELSVLNGISPKVGTPAASAPTPAKPLAAAPAAAKPRPRKITPAPAGERVTPVVEKPEVLDIIKPKAGAADPKPTTPAKATPAKGKPKGTPTMGKPAPSKQDAATAKRDAKRRLARAVLLAVETLVNSDYAKDADFSKEEAAEIVSQWLHHLPVRDSKETGEQTDSRPWWPLTFPLPDRSDWR
jgi:hypothetical protein